MKRKGMWKQCVIPFFFFADKHFEDVKIVVKTGVREMADAALTENLAKALKCEWKLYSELLKLAENKTDCLVRNDVTGLSRITEEEGKLAEQAKQLAKIREQYATGMNQTLGLDANASLEEAEKRLPDSQAATLADIRKKLRETLSKLTARNGINRRLIENAMEYINFSLELLSAPAPESSVYSRSGTEVKSGSQRSLLDIRS